MEETRKILEPSNSLRDQMVERSFRCRKKFIFGVILPLTILIHAAGFWIITHHLEWIGIVSFKDGLFRWITLLVSSLFFWFAMSCSDPVPLGNNVWNVPSDRFANFEDRVTVVMAVNFLFLVHVVMLIGLVVVVWMGFHGNPISLQ